MGLALRRRAADRAGTRALLPADVYELNDMDDTYCWEVWRDGVPPRAVPFVRHCERAALAVPHKNVSFGGGIAAPKPPLNGKGGLNHALQARYPIPNSQSPIA